MEFDLYGGGSQNKSLIRSFGGLNRTRRAQAGEAEDMLNMSSAEYPCAAPRGSRVRLCGVPSVINATAAPDITFSDKVEGFTGVGDGAFYYNGVIKSGSRVLDTSWSWEVIRMGNLYVINGCFKEEKISVMYYYNVDTNVFSYGGAVMDNLIVSSGKNSKGNYIHTFRAPFTEVYNYSVKDVNGRWIKNSDFFRTYGSNGGALPSQNIFEKYFSVGDELSISGFPEKEKSVGQVWSYTNSNSTVHPQYVAYDANNTVDLSSYASPELVSQYDIVSARVKSFDVSTVSVSGVSYYVHYLYFDLFNKNGDAVDFDDMAIMSHYCSGITVAKKKPVFDHIAAHHNRIWGTSFSGNAVYASASDDIFSFTGEEINAMYAARLTSDTPGCFTALCKYGSELAAFKPDSITVICGSNAANYSSYVIKGVGCIDPYSVCETPTGIFFLSYRGFYLFSGGEPQCVSDKLNTVYESAVCGCDGRRVFAAAVSGDGKKELLVLDMKNGMWHREDDAQIFASFGFQGDIMLVMPDGIYRCSERDVGESFEWSFTSARLFNNSLDNSAVTEIWVRAELEDGAFLTVETSAGDGEFLSHASFTSPGLNVFRCPVRALMSNVWRWRISGRGRCVIYDVELKSAAGGRRYKSF